METKFLIIGDLHGVMPKLHFKDFDAIIVPGDVCSDEHTRKYKLAWEKLNKKRKKIVSWEEYMEGRVGEKDLKKLDRESLKRGRKVMEFLNKFDRPVFFIPGNWDKSYKGPVPRNMSSDYAVYTRQFLNFWMAKRTNPFLTKGLKNVVDCQMRIVPFREFEFIGYGLVSGPEMIPRRKSKMRYSKKKDVDAAMVAYKKLEGMVVSLFKRRKKGKTTIFLSHNVPYNTRLDLLLDKTSHLHKTHMGSSLARKMINRFKPLVCIGGHMHEHFNKQKLGPTTVVNAGFGAKVNVLLTMKDGRLKKTQFYPKKYGGRSR